MRLVLLLLILTLLSCKQRQAVEQFDNELVIDTEIIQSTRKVDTTVIQVKEKTNGYSPCDSLKIKNFKNNLTLINQENFKELYVLYDKKAKEYIDNKCKIDSLFCGEIKRKVNKGFRFNQEWTLYLFGYVFGQGEGMEENSVSFYLFTIYRNNKIWFSDTFEELEGEIQVELNGFEDQKDIRQVTVWGHIYPYFSPDYGKFRLTIKNGVSYYEYECHSYH